MPSNSAAVRLNKFLAAAGEGSRRACDERILQGRVEVNGEICINPATRIGPGDHVRIDGRRVATTTEHIVVAMYKPRGLVCTRSDERQRETIYAALPPMLHSLHHTGRLDLDSEGLLVLTNDGALTQRLMHPRSGIEKEYHVTANQAVESEHLAQLTKGIYTAEGRLIAKHAEVLSPRRLKIILAHGAKRQIRVMLETLGYKVTRLLRVRIGSLWLGDLKPGEYAALTPAEVAMLMENPPPPAVVVPVAKDTASTPRRLNRRATPKAKSTPPPPRKTAKKNAFKTARKTAVKRVIPARKSPRRNHGR
jgi:23S rRNA pseudouridine2605 synthase